MWLIDKIRDAIVIRMSEVEKQKANGDRVIKNGEDRYTVKVTKKFNDKIERYEGDPHYLEPYDADWVCFVVTDGNGKSEEVIIEKLSNYSGICSCQIRKKGRSSGVNLSFDTDVDDINSVRYQLEQKSKYQALAAEFAYFIDKFVLVTPEEREEYKKYVNEIEEQEKQEQKRLKEQKKQEKKARKLREAQEKLEEEKSKKEAERQKVVHGRFFGKSSSK